MRKEENNKLMSVFEFKSFNEAFGLRSRIALLSEKMKHLPDRRNVCNKIIIELTTHDAGYKITEKDRRFALQIDTFFTENYKS